MSKKIIAVFVSVLAAVALYLLSENYRLERQIVSEAERVSKIKREAVWILYWKDRVENAQRVDRLISKLKRISKKIDVIDGEDRVLISLSSSNATLLDRAVNMVYESDLPFKELKIEKNSKGCKLVLELKKW